jgi:hypothetical protein
MIAGTAPLNIIGLLILGLWLAAPHVALGQGSGISDTVDADALSQQVIELSEQARYSEALPLAERALAIREKVLGPKGASAPPRSKSSVVGSLQCRSSAASTNG